MEEIEIILVSGWWKFERRRWVFSVDERRGCRMLCANSKTLFEKFSEMVYEDFGVKNQICKVRLSYMVGRNRLGKLPEDTPPIFVINGRQFEGYLRQCKGESVRLCVEIEDEKTRVPLVDEDWVGDAGQKKTKVEEEERKGESESAVKPKKRNMEEEETNLGNQGKKNKKAEDLKNFKGYGNQKKEEGKLDSKGLGVKDADYYGMKKEGKRVVSNECVEEEKDIEDEDEKYRFDYCDDTDGASSGDEDYDLYSKFAEKADEEGVEEVGEGEKGHGGNNFHPNVKKNNFASRNGIVKGETDIEMGVVDLAEGQQFPSKQALEDRLKKLTVLHKFDFTVGRSRPHLYTVHCWVSGCTWRVRASTIGDSPVFHIRIYVPNHSCSVTERSARARKATPKILGELYKEFVGGVGAGVVPHHVGDGLNLRYGSKVAYWKAHRTLKAARESVSGTYESGYQELPSYLYRIRRANPGTHTRLAVDEFERFKFVFIAFGASIAGFKYMRKVVVVDGTFLKGKYKGTLLLATTQDGNFNIFPLAFAVVDTENDESWEWFFRQLSCAIPDDKGLALISDRHKSIGNAIDKVYPLAARGVCTYHLHKNILVKYRGSETFRLVKKAATAYRVSDFNGLFNQIQGLNPDLHSYLQRADVRMWSRAHFPGDRYNFTTTNIAESLNKVLNPARKYTIVQLLDAVRVMLTRWFAKRRNQAEAMTTTLTKGVEKLLEVRVDKAKVLNVQEIDKDQYEVTSGPLVYVVNLTRKMCSCRRFDLEKLPCIHAIAAAETVNISRIGQCHSYYTTDYLCKGYAKSIMPKDTSCVVPDLFASKVCNPPFVRTPPGRPKLARIKGPMEVAMNRKRPRKTHTCSKCQGAGHNRTTCPS